jgi:S-methylmethionine-dependent homocysteine/selenocysteine methylase
MLPRLGGELFLTDGGMETSLVFVDGFELPQFASFPLLDDERGREALRAYYLPYVQIAKERGLAIVLDAPTWRASSRWGKMLGYDDAALADVNRRAVALVEEIRSETGGSPPIVIGGCVGPRDDAYQPEQQHTVDELSAYHRPQIATLAGTAADLIDALTLTYAAEAIAIAQAAKAEEQPVAISFTLETDGRLPSGQELSDAIDQVDTATDGSVAYFMVNCAHPTHFAAVLAEGGAWRERIGGIRANASRKSHAELDESDELDAGDPDELAGHYAVLQKLLPNLSVAGGCCGTDHRHIAAIAAALAS